MKVFHFHGTIFSTHRISTNTGSKKVNEDSIFIYVSLAFERRSPIGNPTSTSKDPRVFVKDYKRSSFSIAPTKAQIPQDLSVHFTRPIAPLNTPCVDLSEGTFTFSTRLVDQKLFKSQELVATRSYFDTRLSNDSTRPFRSLDRFTPLCNLRARVATYSAFFSFCNSDRYCKSYHRPNKKYPKLLGWCYVLSQFFTGKLDASTPTFDDPPSVKRLSAQPPAFNKKIFIPFQQVLRKLSQIEFRALERCLPLGRNTGQLSITNNSTKVGHTQVPTTAQIVQSSGFLQIKFLPQSDGEKARFIQNSFLTLKSRKSLEFSKILLANLYLPFNGDSGAPQRAPQSATSRHVKAWSAEPTTTYLLGSQTVLVCNSFGCKPT